MHSNSRKNTSWNTASKGMTENIGGYLPGGVPRFNAKGIFEGFIGACMDIHEQIVYQQKLKENEEKLNIIIEASELGNWELNLRTAHVIYSDRYLEILGYNKGAVLTHQEILTRLHPDDLRTRSWPLKPLSKPASCNMNPGYSGPMALPLDRRQGKSLL